MYSEIAHKSLKCNRIYLVCPNAGKLVCGAPNVLVLEPKAGGADVMVGVPKENPNAARKTFMHLTH